MARRPVPLPAPSLPGEPPPGPRLPGDLRGLRREGTPLCGACAGAFAVRAGTPAGTPLGMPSDVPLPLVQLEWCAAYGGIVRDALHALKYAGERRLAGPLGAAAAARWREAAIGGDLLVHVPVHAARRAARGYDQAELLARAAAEALGLPAVAALRRDRATAPQFELGRDRRAANVACAFGVDPARAPAVAGSLGGPRRRRRHDRGHARRLRAGTPGCRRRRGLGSHRRPGGVMRCRTTARRSGGTAPDDRVAGRSLKPGGRPILDGTGCSRTPRPAHRPARAQPWRSAVRTIVKGKNIDVPDSVRRYAERKMRRLERFLDDRTDAIIELSVEHHGAPTTRGSQMSPSSSTARRSAAGRTASRRRPRSTRSSTRSSAGRSITARSPGSGRAGPRRRRSWRGSPTARPMPGHERRDRQDEAVRHRADVRGGRHRRDGGRSATRSSSS